MANPNIVAVTTIYGTTTYYTPTGTVEAPFTTIQSAFNAVALLGAGISQDIYVQS